MIVQKDWKVGAIFRGEIPVKYVLRGEHWVWAADKPVTWEPFWYIVGERGWYLRKNETSLGNGSGIRLRSILFPVLPDRTYTVSKNIRTTMRIGFLENRDDRVLIAPAVEAAQTLAISGTAPDTGAYCVCQICVNADVKDGGSGGRGTRTWDEIIEGLTIQVQ